MLKLLIFMIFNEKEQEYDLINPTYNEYLEIKLDIEIDALSRDE